MFKSLLEKAEAGREVYSQAFSAGYVAIWYEDDDGTQYQVQYDDGIAESVQIVGEMKVYFPD